MLIDQLSRLQPGSPSSPAKRPAQAESGRARRKSSGLRILVVEDEAAISLLLEDMLLDFGCEVIGPAARLAVALEAVSKEAIDLAILDVNVAGEPIYPVADALALKSIPFVFSTCYGSAGIKDVYRDRPVLQKPFAQNDLKQKLVQAKNSRASA